MENQSQEGSNSEGCPKCLIDNGCCCRNASAVHSQDSFPLGAMLTSLTVSVEHCAATLSSVKASLLNLIQWANLFIHTLDGGNRRSFVVPDDTHRPSIHWAADSYQTILPRWKDHMTCRGPKRVTELNWINVAALINMKLTASTWAQSWVFEFEGKFFSWLLKCALTCPFNIYSWLS